MAYTQEPIALIVIGVLVLTAVAYLWYTDNLKFQHRALWCRVVQLVEQGTVNPHVAGSSPASTANCFGNTEFGDCNTDRNVTEYLSLMGGKVDSKGQHPHPQRDCESLEVH